MERRLHKIMAHVDKCITEHPNGVRGVVMSEFHNNVSHLNYANLLGFILYLRNWIIFSIFSIGIVSFT